MINPKFEALLSNPDVKFTIILGSGFHYQAIGGDSILSSWELLLRKIGSTNNFTGQYHLDFERIIQANKILYEDSYKTESRLIGEVQKFIKEAQEKVVSQCAHCYPLDIFNPDKISDVISLNFDEVPELLLSKRKTLKLSRLKNDSSFKLKSKESYAFLSTSYKSLDFGGGRLMRFWHPHGVVGHKKSIVLGLHRYAHMVENVLSIRKHHMRAKKSNAIDNTWYCGLLTNPVLIIGAGISSTEWDIWYALASRERANGDKQQIFQMRECVCKKDSQNEWFEPLFTGLSYKDQWHHLVKLLKS